MNLKKRTLIRIVSFGIAAIVLLMIRNYDLMQKNRRREVIIKNSYIRALEDLSAAADNINNTLEKQLYSGTSAQQAVLANKLFTQAAAAKSSMSQLPMQELSLENTYKFLSQVGNYAQSIAEHTDDTDKLSKDDYNNLKALHQYAQKLSDKLWEIEQAVACGEIDISEVSDDYIDRSSPMITEGFTEFEEGFSSYPTLIYDGPFSDHIMQKEPEMTKNAEPISRKKALERAAAALNVSANDLTEIVDQEGQLPCWLFSDKDHSLSCAVTKQGGYVSYFLRARQPDKADISVEEAVDKSKAFIEDAGYKNMKVTYYERVQNTVVVNFAYAIDGVTCYTDLMKVTVAMDDGEILGFDAAGYIVNHQKRSFPDKVISVKECEKQLSPYLKCESRGQALIPTDGGGEVYCYEYKCSAPDGRHILVYINARTGKEEQILILLESEDGTLTM